tara:strand:- start:1962 stop:2834 length:873 start_codon:yes stop_codon:yes gene_type:complete
MFGSGGFSASAFGQSPDGPTVVLTGVSALALTPAPAEESGGAITENSFAEAPFASENSTPFTITVNTEGSISVTGVQATAQTSGVVFNESFGVIGVGATGSVGSAIVSLPTGIGVTGVSATGIVGGNNAELGGSLFGGLSFAEEPFAGLADDVNSSIDVATGVSVSVTGVGATGATASVVVNAGAIVSVTGVTATGGAGSASVVGAGNISVTGVAATGSAGTVSITEGVGPNVAVSSPRLQGQVGIVSPNAEIKVFLTGVAANGQTSGASVVSWNEITVNQDPNWVEIAA